MTIFMLGWEFPPYLTGGLGTACYGLTKALAARNAKVIFVMPRPITPQPGDFVRVVAPSFEAYSSYEAKAKEDARLAATARKPVATVAQKSALFVPAMHDLVDADHAGPENPAQPRVVESNPLAGLPVDDPAFANVEFKVIDLPGLVSPYQSERPPEVADAPVVPALDSEPFSAHCRAGFANINPNSDASLAGPESLDPRRLRLIGKATPESPPAPNPAPPSDPPPVHAPPAIHLPATVPSVAPPLPWVVSARPLSFHYQNKTSRPPATS